MHPEDHERKVSEAHKDKSVLRAMIELLKNNDFACSVEIMGMDYGICNNPAFIPFLEAEILEIDKFLNNQENLWE
jgi:hypothetical protein